MQIKFLEKQLWKDTTLKNNYTKTISQDLEIGYLITVRDVQMVELRSDGKWYLAHHLVINPKEPEKVVRVINGAANFHGTSNKTLLTCCELLHNLIHVLLTFRQHQNALFTDIEYMFLQAGVPDRDQTFLFR